MTSHDRSMTPQDLLTTHFGRPAEPATPLPLDLGPESVDKRQEAVELTLRAAAEMVDAELQSVIELIEKTTAHAKRLEDYRVYLIKTRRGLPAIAAAYAAAYDASSD